MDTYFLPSVYRYLATHSVVAISASSGGVVAVILIASFCGRELFRVSVAAQAVRRVGLRRFSILTAGTALVAVATVLERFAVLS